MATEEQLQHMYALTWCVCGTILGVKRLLLWTPKGVHNGRYCIIIIINDYTAFATLLVYWSSTQRGPDLEIREYGRRRSAAQTTRHSSIHTEAVTNFADKRRSLCRYSCLVDSGHGVCFYLFFYTQSIRPFGPAISPSQDLKLHTEQKHKQNKGTHMSMTRVGLDPKPTTVFE
jgi:hypothetical protein